MPTLKSSTAQSVRLSEYLLICNCELALAVGTLVSPVYLYGLVFIVIYQYSLYLLTAFIRYFVAQGQSDVDG